ncbi:RING-H2 finger protein ATL80, variant 2 [Balamuthia mandrillaris]
MEAANRHNNNFVDLEEGRRPEGAFRRDGEDGDLARLLQHLSPPSLWAEEDEEGGGEEAHMTADSSTTTRGDQPLQEDQQAVGISDLSPSTRRVLSGCYWSYLCFMLSSLMAVVVALVTALSVNGSNTCEKPLRAWASVEICIVVAQAVLTLLIHCKFGGSLNLDSLHRHPNVPRLVSNIFNEERAEQAERERERKERKEYKAINLTLFCKRGTLVTAYSFNRLLNMFWFIWFIVGCSWTFADTDCVNLFFLPLNRIFWYGSHSSFFSLTERQGASAMDNLCSIDGTPSNQHGARCVLLLLYMWPHRGTLPNAASVLWGGEGRLSRSDRT